MSNVTLWCEVWIVGEALDSGDKDIWDLCMFHLILLLT